MPQIRKSSILAGLEALFLASDQKRAKEDAEQLLRWTVWSVVPHFDRVDNLSDKVPLIENVVKDVYQSLNRFMSNDITRVIAHFLWWVNNRHEDCDIILHYRSRGRRYFFWLEVKEAGETIKISEEQNLDQSLKRFKPDYVFKFTIDRKGRTTVTDKTYDVK